MAEAEATIPQEVETIPEKVETIPEKIPNEQKMEESPSPVPKKRGRPAGSKDRAPRASKPRVRSEPIPQQATEQAAEPAAEPAAQAVRDSKPLPTPAPAPPETEPPSPRTLYRQTSQQLLTLRDLVNTQKTVLAADKYTTRLSNWPVV